MSTSGLAWSTRLRRRAVQTVLALLAVALFAAPFGIAQYLHWLDEQVSEQHSTPAAVLTPDFLAAAEAAGAGLPRRTPPVVLAYHDIRPVTATTEYPDPRKNPKYHLVVTPEAFEQQMAALKAAGYTSITSDQYVAYLNGGEVPQRSVLITFDDGTHGLWTYADRILERHGMHGVSFLITGNVGANRPYYLSWEEIERMAESGRWDFQSHTRKMHARLPIDAEGTRASEMVHRRWLFEKNRLETLDEFETKIRRDLQGSVQDVVDHGLPRPTLFAFPFSEGFQFDGSDVPAATTASAVLQEMFVCSFNNAPPQPLPSGARGAAMGMVGRVELTINSTVAELLDAVRAHTPVTPEQAPPDRRADLWTTVDGTPAPVRVDGDEVKLLGAGRWQMVAYGPHATADWASYRGSVTLRGLSAKGVGNASVVTRVGSDKEVQALVSSNFVRLTARSGSGEVLIGQRPLVPADRHTVVFDVSPDAVRIVVDGRTTLTAPSDGRADSYGGIGLTSYRDNPGAPWPTFTDLTIAAGADSPSVRSGAGVPAAG